MIPSLHHQPTLTFHHGQQAAPACRPRDAHDDQTLLAMMQSPNASTRQAGWAAWYSRDRQKLAAYVCRRSRGLRCGDAAEDLVQDAFVIGFRRISEGRYEDRGCALLAFLYGIARNLLRSTARRQQRDSGDNACLDFTPSGALPVEQRVVVAQVLDMVCDSRARLPVTHRNVIDGLYGRGQALARAGRGAGQDGRQRARHRPPHHRVDLPAARRRV